MKKTIYRLTITAAEVACVWLWCFQGIEGAGNVFAVWAWTIFVGSLFGFTEAKQREMALHPENCKPMFWRWFTVIPLTSAMIWFGHISTGLAYLIAHTGMEAYRAKALEKAQAVKADAP